MNRRLKVIVTVSFSIILSAALWFGRDLRKIDTDEPVSETDDKTDIQIIDKETDKKGNIKKAIQVGDISFTRISNQEIQICWSDQKDPYVSKYTVKKRRNGESDWEILSTYSSDGVAGNREFSFVDTLEEVMPQQFEFRVDIEVIDDTVYEAVEGKSLLASNILICIDPGHYAGQNAVYMDGNSYAEGDFTLELAKELKQILEESCGITAYLTRETGSVSMNGYTDGVLDNNYINLRGEYARGSELFISLHTNANLENANGYATTLQPIEIMKPIIIANTAACENRIALAVGNAVGEHLADSNYKLGIGMPDKFRRVEQADEIISWTDAWNDALDTVGTVCCRIDEYGDYYGVLRGAADVGVPGLIIEHGFHTVPEMRELASRGDLKIHWARADAAGIAEGFGMEFD